MRSDRFWSTPPGGGTTSSTRKLARTVLGSVLVGALSVGMAWAGAGLVPIGTDSPTTPGAQNAIGTEESGTQSLTTADTTLPALGDGQILAGAVKVSMRPAPPEGETWVHADEPTAASIAAAQAKCETMRNPQNTDPKQVVDTRVRWHENSNCIYMGGYDIGPANAIVSWPSDDSPTSLYVRALALSDGKDTTVLMLVDAAYWFADYGSMCDDCGFTDLRKSLSNELGIPESNFLFASTHSHTAPDFVGAWGGVPRWYIEQIRDSIKTAVGSAVANMRPALLETGEEIVREFNSERRGHYRSAEEQNLAWFRVIDANDQPREVCTTPPPSSPTPTPTKAKKKDPTPTPEPEPTPICETDEGSAIATVGAYAAHPTRGNKRAGVANSDFPGVFASEVENSGGIGFMFQTGLGNMSQKEEVGTTGRGLATYIPPLDSGRDVLNTDVKVGFAAWDQPVTNSVLGGGGMAGIFDHPFNQLPAAVSVSKGEFLGTNDIPGAAQGFFGNLPDHGPHKRCNSASPISVRSSVSAVRVGSLWITGAPGEIFSNYSNTLREANPGDVTLPLALVNDGLGYIMQSFETDHAGRQAVGFVNGPFSEYEDAYSIDHCFGDAALENTLDLVELLRK